MRKSFFLSFILFTFFGFSQLKPIVLTESSFEVKNRSSERFYFGLKAGDKITFTIEVSSAIKEISFEEYDGGSLFNLSHSDSISNHSIEIEHDGIYYFSFKQAGFLAGKRYCSLKAYRTPSSIQNEKFNTTVYWETKVDTIKYVEIEKYISRIDTIITQVVNQNLEVGKKGILNSGNIMFNLPDSCRNWSFFVSSEKNASENFNKSELEFAENSALVKKHGLMAGIAMNGVASFSPSSKCKEFEYGFVYKKFEEHEMLIDSTNALLGMKKVCLDFARIRNLKKNPTHLLVRNKSKKNIKIHVRITAVEYKEIWSEQAVEKFKIESKAIPYLKN